MSLSESQEPKAYKPAMNKARNRLARTEVEDIINQTDISFENNHFIIPGLNQEYYVEYPSGEVSNSQQDIPVAIGMKIVILHFLTRGNNWSPTNKLVSYKELPNGNVYEDAFQREAVQPIIDSFSYNLTQLQKVAQKLGASFINKGDLGFKINALPTVPVTYILWSGDDELTGGANILFDSSVITKLHTEDLAFLGEYITSLLLKFKE
ncbi:DUF3786 domain-containing protein [Selenihalanaerobacter shriftii]|uniref:DUF3786 domain-containing protein n=1 Tax=Selenihalanaerobacter shriftii TaxID=142842 RepID=A0A1T4JM52_9FIRM|nr:DUF3786 domain-containing protein [Selenihalanaerobacter shriftii]SJZ31244.1 protein of unknown function [Selenihalanaerobacter shriftii]